VSEKAREKVNIKAKRKLRNMRPDDDLSQVCSETVRSTNPNRGGFMGPRRREVASAGEADLLATRRRHGGDWLGTSLATIIAAMPIVRLVISGGADSGRMDRPKTTKESQIEAKRQGAAMS
jgi:hypothetical protein